MNPHRTRVCGKIIKLKTCWFCILISFLSISYIFPTLRTKFFYRKSNDVIHLAAVSCGRPNHQGVRDILKPLYLTVTMVKSAVLFTQIPLHIHIFTEEDMVNIFDTEFQSWPKEIQSRVQFSINTIDYNQFLTREMSVQWKKWYKPCGSYRLLLPMILKDVTTAAIYSDSDVIFVKPIDQLWSLLKTFNSHHTVAISPTSGHSLGGSENNQNFIRNEEGLFQINSGVMVMNFSRMLSYDWLLYHDESGSETKEKVQRLKYGVDLLLKYYSKYKTTAEHDQKLLNIMFHFNPDRIKQMSCSWNFKNNFCLDNTNVCEDAETRGGAGAVHGITSVFFGNENPTFRSLYEAFLNYDFEDDVTEKLLRPFLKQLEDTAKGSFCMKKSHVIVGPLTTSINQLMERRRAN